MLSRMSMRSRHTGTDAHISQRTVTIDEAIEIVSGYAPAQPLSHAKSGPSDLGNYYHHLLDNSTNNSASSGADGVKSTNGSLEKGDLPSDPLLPSPHPPPALHSSFQSALDFAGIGSYQSFILLFCGWQWLIGSMCTLMPVFVEHSTHESKSAMPTSIAADWGLEGDKAWRLGVLGSLFFFGWFLGSILIGSQADRIGRRAALTWAMGLFNIVAFLQIFAPNYWVYAVLRVIAGYSSGGLQLVAYVLATEWTLERRKVFVGAFFFPLSFVMGELFLVLCCYLVHPWRLRYALLAVLSWIPFVFLVGLPESPRWLCDKGEHEAAHTLLSVAGKANARGTEVYLPPLSKADGDGHGKGGLRDFFQSNFGKTMIWPISFLWMAASFGYYGISLNVGRLSGSVFLNAAVSAIIEIPGKVLAYILVDSPRLGRKSTIPYFYLFTSLSALVMLCAPLHLRTYIALAGKMGVTAAFASIYVYSSELFPTIFRNVGLGICSSSARVGSMLAPQVVVLFREPYTTLIFGAVSFAACVTMLAVLPETCKPRLSKGADAQQQGNSTAHRLV